MEGEGSIHVEVDELQRMRLSETISIGTTMFEPRGLSSIDKFDSNSTVNSVSPTTSAPEKKLTLFALQLAVLEKAATGLGTLGFIWATVVLLGGFAITLEKTDFWFITIILVVEGTRIFSRSHELEWQHQATWSITEVVVIPFTKKKKKTFRDFFKINKVFYLLFLIFPFYWSTITNSFLL